MSPADGIERAAAPFHPRSDLLFFIGMSSLGGTYVLMVVLLIVADLAFTSVAHLISAIQVREIRYAFMLSILSCSVTTILSLWVAVPVGYLLSRYGDREAAWSRTAVKSTRIKLKRGGLALVDAILDVPIVLPPLVVGISLLILFRYPPFVWVSDWVVFEIPAVILAQFMVGCAFAVRSMRGTFDQISTREENVAMTLGASHSQAFWSVVLPQAHRGLLTAGTICWARAFGEFGPILVFASSTRMQTEVLPTTVYLEMQAGNLEAALAVSVYMIFCAILVLVFARLIGLRNFA